MGTSNDILIMEETLKEKGFNLSVSSRLKKREAGYQFTFDEHCEAMVLSLISANRPWVQIAQNLDNLKEVFKGYNGDYLENEDPQVLVNGVMKLGCGNRAIVKQMQGLSGNVKMFRYIENVIGGPIDNLAANNDPYAVSKILSEQPYKLNCMGQTLCLQYLRNVGIDTCKPDVHIRRILSRLGLIPYEDCDIYTIVKCFEKLSKELNLPITHINNIVWTYGATGYGEICAKTPKCAICNVKDCRFKSYMQ